MRITHVAEREAHSPAGLPNCGSFAAAVNKARGTDSLLNLLGISAFSRVRHGKSRKVGVEYRRNSRTSYVDGYRREWRESSFFRVQFT